MRLHICGIKYLGTEQHVNNLGVSLYGMLTTITIKPLMTTHNLEDGPSPQLSNTIGSPNFVELLSTTIIIHDFRNKTVLDKLISVKVFY